MKWIGFLVLVSLMGAGCTPPSFLRNDPPPAKKVEIAPPPAPPIVLPETVNEKNAAQSAKALREELEFEESAIKKSKTPDEEK